MNQTLFNDDLKRIINSIFFLFLAALRAKKKSFSSYNGEFFFSFFFPINLLINSLLFFSVWTLIMNGKFFFVCFERDDCPEGFFMFEILLMFRFLWVFFWKKYFFCEEVSRVVNLWKFVLRNGTLIFTQIWILKSSDWKKFFFMVLTIQKRCYKGPACFQGLLSLDLFKLTAHHS